MLTNKDDICARFSKVSWHDSELINLHLVKVPGKRQYDLALDVNLITDYTKVGPEMTRHTAVFVGCRRIRADIDLLGILICGGAIACGVCYTDATEIQREKFDPQFFDFPQDRNPVDGCLAFLIQMIHPGGEFLVLAQDFQLSRAEEPDIET